MARCASCGKENPGFVHADPPAENVYSTDEGTEWGLMAVGLGGLVAGARLFTAKSAAAWMSPLGSLCLVVGVAGLVAFRLLTVGDLRPGEKTALRIAIGAALAVFGGVYWFIR
jgi:hypothetical protein